jgi:hypothetical protein
MQWAITASVKGVRSRARCNKRRNKHKMTLNLDKINDKLRFMAVRQEEGTVFPPGMNLVE